MMMIIIFVNKWGMCISAAMLKQVSTLKIVHASITKSCHVKGLLWKGETRDLGGFNPWAVPQRNKRVAVFCFPPAEVDPNKAFEDVDIW